MKWCAYAYRITYTVRLCSIGYCTNAQCTGYQSEVIPICELLVDDIFTVLYSSGYALLLHGDAAVFLAQIQIPCIQRISLPIFTFLCTP